MSERFLETIKTTEITNEFVQKIYKEICGYLNVENLVFENEGSKELKEKIISFLISKEEGKYDRQRAELIFNGILESNKPKEE